MPSRRNLLKGALAGFAAAGLGSLSLAGAGKPSPQADDGWHREVFAGTRETTSAELASLASDLHRAAVREGYDPERLRAASYQATMSVSPRGTQIGRIAAVFDENSVVSLTREYGVDRYDRHAMTAMWTDGVQVVAALPSSHAEALRAGLGGDAAVMAASTKCCMYPGGSAGTCCVFDLKGMFECCGPCAFGGIVGGLACAAIWCNYCYSSHCKQWYRYCGSL